MTKCGCKIRPAAYNVGYKIVRCRLHEAAGELLRVAQSTVSILETYASDATGGIVDRLKAAIKKASS